MIKNRKDEIWKPLSFSGSKGLRKKYAVSSLGRIASYSEGVLKDGTLLNGSVTTGYKTLNLHLPGSGTIYIHRAIARLFLKKPSLKHKFVIHKNHNKLDNRCKNLEWATEEKVNQHQQKSPAKLAYKKVQANREKGLRLTATQVRKIKAQLFNDNRRLTIQQLADRYSVSSMTLYRIKSGENWKRIELEME